jgi:hypothetical protein
MSKIAGGGLPQGASVALRGVDLGATALVEATYEVAKPADEFKLTEGTGERSSQEPRDESPFRNLASGARALPPRELGRSLSLEKDVDLPLESAEMLMALEGRLAPSLVEELDKVRTGAMLTAADAQGKLPPAALKVVETVAQKIAARNKEAAAEALTTFVKQERAVFFRNQQDVNAMVQRTLRESYLMGPRCGL